MLIITGVCYLSLISYSEVWNWKSNLFPASITKQTQNHQKKILHYSSDQYHFGKNGSSARGDIMYLQSPNYKNRKDSSNLENYSEA